MNRSSFFSIEFNMSLFQWINRQYQHKDLIITTKGIIDPLHFWYIFYVVKTQKYLWQTLVCILGKQIFLRHPPPPISGYQVQHLRIWPELVKSCIWVPDFWRGRGKLTLIEPFPFLSVTYLNIFDFELFVLFHETNNLVSINKSVFQNNILTTTTVLRYATQK